VGIDLGSDYTPNAALTDDYRCFVVSVDPALTADQYLTGYEFIPGDALVVHHAILFAMGDATAEQRAVDLDAADPAPGYTCFGGTRTGSDLVVAAWAPGVGPTRLPAGTGPRLRAGRKMVLQIHYNLENGAYPDHSRMRLQVASKPLDLRAGDVVKITCGYDTSSRTTETTWGEGTADEMCLAGFYLTTQ
jgi:hypothetical protein